MVEKKGQREKGREGDLNTIQKKRVIIRDDWMRYIR